ncbi:pyridoxal phosphate-dependent aminotransferase [bacterium]|nr:pyridoxal phosphate-dependent aminotransferase [bacterium]
MSKLITSHLEHISSFLAMEVFAKAEELEKQGRDIIHLEFGEPDFPTPEIIANVGIQSIRDARTKYTHTQGIEDFRNAVVKKYKRQYNVGIAPSQILTSSGSSILLYLAMRLLIPPGDEVIMTDLCYACYDNLAMIGGAKPVRVSLRLENGFQLDIDEVKKAITPRTRAILINSPMNPTGTVLSEKCMRELAELGIPIISDEIYGDLVYEGEPYSALNFTENCIVLNGLSKFYAMTGWRLGYMIMKPEWVKVAARVHQNMMISAAHFVQDAGTVAINEAESECRKMAEEFDNRRRFLLKRLKEIGLDPGYNPVGAFYVLLKYPDQSLKSLDLSMDILEKCGVALTPGIDFGAAGEGFLRISYANSKENIDEAINRLKDYFG